MTVASALSPLGERRALETHEVPKVLADVFGVELPADDVKLLLRKLA
ncbi:hypothetical protein [Streptomyces sp. NPDC051162]